MANYLIRSTADDDLFWSNTLGWTTRQDADSFTSEERESVSCVIGGEWVPAATEPTKENLAMDPVERKMVLAIYAELRAAGFISVKADYGPDWEEGDDFCPTGTDDEIINACTDTGMSHHYFLDQNGKTHVVVFIQGNGRDIASDGCACDSFWAPINEVCDRFNRGEFVITLKETQTNV